MADQNISGNNEDIKTLPVWAKELASKYLSKTANLYILHGNIHDLFLLKENKDEIICMWIQEYISEVLFGNRDIIAYYDRSGGITFCEPEMERDYLAATPELFGNTDIDKGGFVSGDPEKSFPYLEKYFLSRIPRDNKEKCRMVFIIDYAEYLVPAGDLLRLSDTCRYCMVTFNRWTADPKFINGGISIILLTENLADISARLTDSPSTVKISVPLPDISIRESFLRSKEKEGRLLLERSLTVKKFASVTPGVSLVNLYRLTEESYEENKPLSLKFIRRKKKEITR